MENGKRLKEIKKEKKNPDFSKNWPKEERKIWKRQKTALKKNENITVWCNKTLTIKRENKNKKRVKKLSKRIKREKEKCLLTYLVNQ